MIMTPPNNKIGVSLMIGVGALLVLVMLSSCAPRTAFYGKAIGDQCNEDTDCDEEEVCRENLCANLFVCPTCEGVESYLQGQCCESVPGCSVAEDGRCLSDTDGLVGGRANGCSDYRYLQGFGGSSNANADRFACVSPCITTLLGPGVGYRCNTNTEMSCTNTLDDDLDSAIDCNDADCLGDAVCTSGCSTTDPSQCTSSQTCTADSVNNYWFVDTCSSECPAYTDDLDMDHICTTVCSSGSPPAYCTTQDTCVDTEHYWTPAGGGTGTCASACSPTTGPRALADENGDHVCLLATGSTCSTAIGLEYLYDSTCESNLCGSSGRCILAADDDGVSDTTETPTPIDTTTEIETSTTTQGTPTTTETAPSAVSVLIAERVSCTADTGCEAPLSCILSECRDVEGLLNNLETIFENQDLSTRRPMLIEIARELRQFFR